MKKNRALIVLLTALQNPLWKYYPPDIAAVPPLQIQTTLEMCAVQRAVEEEKLHPTGECLF